MVNMIKCTMCFTSCVSNNDLMRHVIRYHKTDANFKVKCNHAGCGATFQKWKSFRQHLWRNHSSHEINEFNPGNEADVFINDFINNIESGEEDEPHVNGEEELLWHTTKFLLNIREICRISQTAVEAVIIGVQDLISKYISIIMTEAKQEWHSDLNSRSFSNIEWYFMEKYPITSLFSKIDTQKKLDKILVDKFSLILPEEHIIHKEWVWQKKRDGQPILKEVERSAYIVPFLKSLKLLVSNDDVANHLQLSRSHPNDMYKTALDGSIYNTNEFFKNHQNSLAIILYYDDLGVANPLGVSSKNQKLSMFYWTIGNLDPRVRSSKSAIQLLAVVKTAWLNKEGALSKLLQPFIDDIIELQQNGISIRMNDGEAKHYTGSLLFCAGDTPASALLGGFKQSVSAYRFCRQCLITQENWRGIFSSLDCILRDKLSHDNHVAAVNDTQGLDRHVKFWKRRYGVNNKSPLLKIPHFDVTQSLPQDAMHILIEGVVEVGCRKLLRFLILEKKMFSLENFNVWCESFHYYGYLKRDKPAVILIEHLTSNLRQNASQMFVLAHFLPFLVIESVKHTKDADVVDRLWSHVRLLQIMNMCLSYEVDVNSIYLLSRMIELYIRRFDSLYPNSLIPKMHFLIHIPLCIWLLGPARQQWCFRFESAHAYYKSLVPVIKNFKNMAYSVAYRHQANLCCNLATMPGQKSKFLYKGHDIHEGVTVLLNNLPCKRLLEPFITCEIHENLKLLRTPKVRVYGTEFKPNTVILLQCNEDALPVFGKIKEIFIVEDKICFVYTVLKTLIFENMLNAYRIMNSPHETKYVVSYDELLFPHPLIYVEIGSRKYIGLLNHTRNEFYG